MNKDESESLNVTHTCNSGAYEHEKTLSMYDKNI